MCPYLPLMLARTCTEAWGVDGRSNLQNDHTLHVIVYDNISPALCMNRAAIVQSKYWNYFTEE